MGYFIIFRGTDKVSEDRVGTMPGFFIVHRSPGAGGLDSLDLGFSKERLLWFSGYLDVVFTKDHWILCQDKAIERLRTNKV